MFYADFVSLCMAVLNHHIAARWAAKSKEPERETSAVHDPNLRCNRRDILRPLIHKLPLLPANQLPRSEIGSHRLVDTVSQAVLNVHCSTNREGSDADLAEQIAR